MQQGQRLLIVMKVFSDIVPLQSDLMFSQA